MKSVGIITYHHYYNYGTMLQAFALQQVIKDLSYNAEIIDFKQSNDPDILHLIMIRLRRLPVYLAEREKYKTLAAAKASFDRRNIKYEEFYKKYLHVGKQIYINSEKLKADPPEYDAYIVGSDQTWNPYVANNPEAFYLTFISDNKKKGSYAPSLGVTQLTQEQKKMFQSRLEGFGFVSCRESEGAKLLSDIIHRPVANVIDPTLLLGWNIWSTVSKKSVISQPYILTYFLGDITEHRIFVHKLASITGLKVVSIPVSYLDIRVPEFEKVWAGPDEFLSLIRNAEYVCTDSFHGTIFSINFGVKFYSFCKRKDAEISSDNSRLYSSLKLFGLSDRLITVNNANKALSRLDIIDYKEVDRVLNRERERSIKYLETMLNDITQ